jgi:peptidoglycan hydrolase-like protein with peptidoglycan-binding domain
VVAPLVAAVLGIGGGVATALVVPADDEPSTEAVSDPLHLNIPLADLDCSGQSILVVGYGNSVPPLSSAVANSSEDDLHYLSSAGSCATLLGPEDKASPTYVVYSGPYDSPRDPCEVRMSGEEPGSFVARLREGNTQLVKCPCEIPGTDAVRLYPDMPVDASAKLWIRGLQAMFNYDDAEDFPKSRITGDYDEFTQARVTVFQDNAPGKSTQPGIVDATTWGILTDRLCRNYIY